MSEKKIFDVRVTRVIKSSAERLLADAEALTGEQLEMRNLDDIYYAIEATGYTHPVVVQDTQIVRAWSASDAQEFVAELYEKDDFSLVMDIEVHEATIWETED